MIKRDGNDGHGGLHCTVLYAMQIEWMSATLQSADCTQWTAGSAQRGRIPSDKQPTANPPSSSPAALRRAACCKPASPLRKPASHSSAQKVNLVQRSLARSPCAHPKSIIQGPGPRLAPIAGLSGNATRTGKSPKGGPKNIINPSKAMMVLSEAKKWSTPFTTLPTLN